MLDDIGDVWAELMMGSPAFFVHFSAGLAFVIAGDWGCLLLSLAFGHAWAMSSENLFVVGINNNAPHWHL